MSNFITRTGTSQVGSCLRRLRRSVNCNGSIALAGHRHSQGSASQLMEIFLYAFSVMYSPGPVNFMALNAGLGGGFRRSLGSFAGVGCALLVLEVGNQQR